MPYVFPPEGILSGCASNTLGVSMPEVYAGAVFMKVKSDGNEAKIQSKSAADGKEGC
jgi:hypothetical protein